MTTTIQIDENIKEKLDNLKIHHRESYNELISRLINSTNPQNCSRESLIETIEVLSDPEAMRNIAEALERFERGERGISFEDLKKELKLNV
jgi:predicted CopG family antitoxin